MSRTVSRAAVSPRSAAVALGAWTLFAWTFRIGTVWGDDDASTTSQALRTALALTFTVFAVVTLWMAVRNRISKPFIRLFAAWTIGVWTIRVAGIATGEREAAFVVVHLILAFVSVVLAVMAARSEH